MQNHRGFFYVCYKEKGSFLGRGFSGIKTRASVGTIRH